MNVPFVRGGARASDRQASPYQVSRAAANGGERLRHLTKPSAPVRLQVLVRSFASPLATNDSLAEHIHSSFLLNRAAWPKTYAALRVRGFPSAPDCPCLP